MFQLKDVSLYNWNWNLQKGLCRTLRKFQLKDVSLYNWNLSGLEANWAKNLFQLKDVSLYNWNAKVATLSLKLSPFQLKDVSLYNWNSVPAQFDQQLISVSVEGCKFVQLKHLSWHEFCHRALCFSWRM